MQPAWPDRADELLDPPSTDPIRLWRELQALRAGLSAEDARRVAAGDGDLDLLRRLVEQGCPPELAARIVV